MATTGQAATGEMNHQQLLAVLSAYKTGDFTARMPGDLVGVSGKIADTLNDIIDMAAETSAEFERVATLVGKQGRVTERKVLPRLKGSWKKMVDCSNTMADDLVSPMNEMIRVVGSVVEGDLSQQVPLEIDGSKVQGQFLKSAQIVNTMVSRLGTFASEVTRVAREVGTEGKLGGQAAVAGVSGTWKDLTDNVNGLAGNLTNQVRAIAEVATGVTKGDLTRSIQVDAKGEVADLKDNVNEMIRNLRGTTQQNSEQDWLKTNLAKFTRLLQGQRDLAAVSKMVLSELAPLINGQHGVFYMMEESEADVPRLKLLSAYAYRERKNLANDWRVGEGLVGQCAYEKQRILLTNVPDDYVEVTSGLGGAKPLNIIVLPIVFESRVKAVIEIASFTLFSAIHQSFLDQLAESIGIVLNTIEANMRTEALLKQSQSLAQELQSQQEELRQTNDELEDKARLLEEQKVEVERKNREVETAKMALEDKAEQLSLTSKYKSEFLSNMSHELRTPLNSLLMLAQQLAENPKGNLDSRQVEYAHTIQGSGKDLLTLINEILDLSKIESGTVTLDLDNVAFAGLSEQIVRTFRHIAENRSLAFDVVLAPDLPASLYTDEKRLLQVIKNLLSNAFKFTDKGRVTVEVELAHGGWSNDHAVLGRAEQVIGFYVTDTGLGVAADKQKLIFEAFQQADTGTARKYGGTGLGLSISREIARLLGGELRLVSSEPGVGSTFALFVPVDTPRQAQGDASGARPGSQKKPASGSAGLVPAGMTRPAERARGQPPARARAPAQQTSEAAAAPPAAEVADDRAAIKPGERSLLIIEDDVRFANILLDAARDKGFKGLVATRGGEALRLAAEFIPSAITLDMHLPDMDGWVVLERLKRNLDTRHIPVEIISVDDNRLRGLRYGAFECLVKPVTSEALREGLVQVRKFADMDMNELLIADGDADQRAKMIELIGDGDVCVTAVATGKEALAALGKKRHDCLVLGLNLPDMDGIELIEAIQANELTRELPVIVYGLDGQPKAEQERIKALALNGIVKQAGTPERLLDETALFLHRVVSKLPEDRRKMLEKLQRDGDSLGGKKVLVVDDDVRNIFALTSVLERSKMTVFSAENGKAAIDLLKQTSDLDILLMDIMMPEMDGYQTMRQIRAMKEFTALPIIALTAKAMKGDREKCIEAGASDYLSKPVDTDQLLSLMRVWLYQ